MPFWQLNLFRASNVFSLVVVIPCFNENFLEDSKFRVNCRNLSFDLNNCISVKLYQVNLIEHQLEKEITYRDAGVDIAAGKALSIRSNLLLIKLNDLKF